MSSGAGGVGGADAVFYPTTTPCTPTAWGRSTRPGHAAPAPLSGPGSLTMTLPSPCARPTISPSTGPFPRLHRPSRRGGRPSPSPPRSAVGDSGGRPRLADPRRPGRGRLTGRLPSLADAQGCRRPYRWQRFLEILDADGIRSASSSRTPPAWRPATAHAYQLIVDQVLTHDHDPRLARHSVAACKRAGDSCRGGQAGHRPHFMDRQASLAPKAWLP